MKTSGILTALPFLLLIPAGLLADSKAYVLASGGGLDTLTLGSITPFNTSKGTLEPAFFAPPNGDFLAVEPITKQIWEVSQYSSVVSILDPTSGDTVATIPLPNTGAAAIVFDPAGQYAYVTAYGQGNLYKIDIASGSVILTSDTIGERVPALSADGSKIFVDNGPAVLALDTGTFDVLATLDSGGGAPGLLVSGNTLLVTNGSTLLYYDTTTLQQTFSYTLPFEYVELIGVSSDGSKLYISAGGDNAPSIAVLEFTTGATLQTQNLPAGAGMGGILSPNGKQIFVGGSTALMTVDAATLETTATVTPIGPTSAAVYYNNNTVFTLNQTVGAMTVIDQATAQVTDTFPVGSELSSAVANSTGGLIYSGGNQNITVVSTKLNRIVENLPVPLFATSVVADGQLYQDQFEGAPSSYNLANKAVVVLTNPTGIPPGHFAQLGLTAAPPDQSAYWVSFAVESRITFIPVASGIVVYSTAKNSPIAEFVTPSITNGPMVFSPDSSTAYIAGPNSILVYNAKTFQSKATYTLPTTFTSLVIGKSGSVLYGTDQTAIYEIDAATGSQTSVFQLPTPVVNSVMAISPDETTLFLTDFYTQNVNLINTASGSVTAVPVPYSPTSIVVVP